MKKFVITENEKKDILGLYGVLNEQDNGIQYLNVVNISGKTYNLYTETGNKSSIIEWVQPNSPHPKLPKEILPNGKDYFEIIPKRISYYSANTELQYSISSQIITNPETYRFSSIYTDKTLIQSAKFRVTINYPTRPKNKWGNISFYGYSEDLKKAMIDNKLI